MLSANRLRDAGKTAMPSFLFVRHLSRTLFLLTFFTFFYNGFNRVSAPATGVVTELLFNEGTGTSTADGSGNGHNGTLTNGPTWVAGKYGQAINFDGANDYLSIADHANFTLDPTVSYTWSAWVKNNNFNAWGTVWSQTIDVNNFFYFYAHTTNDAEAGPVTNGLTLYWWTGGGTNKVVLHSNNNVLTAGQWSYVTLTYNASLAQASRFTIFVNGVDVTNRTDVLSTGTLATINPTSIRMGGNAPWGDYLNGAVDEMRYYRRLLSVAEIQADMNIGNTPDTQAPTVSISTPTSGSTVSATVNVTANASDNVAVTGVQFKLDGVNLGAEDLSAPYTVSWSTTGSSNGAHTLTAVARDAAGNSTTSSAVPITVNNFVDTEVPVVSITSPTTGSTVSSTINVTATATDNVGVTGVQFLLDGVNLGAEDVAAPYTVSWNTATASNASHILTARARDAAGNQATSSNTSIIVFNNNLVAAYGFNENTGTTLNDNSGNANHGTLTNGPLWSAAGKNGAALQFDGVNDLVNINDANSLDLTNGMTVEAWINPSNLTGYKTILCKEQNTNNLAYALSANNNTSGAANQRPNTRIRIGTTNTTATGTSKLALNTWTHIASTFDGTTLRFFINGVQVSTAAVSGSMITTTNMLRIGGSPALGNQYFAGLIDELRIYNRALSASEIQADMNTPVAPDVTNPTVSISSPTNDATVSGTINVTATASDNISVTGVQFLLDGVSLGTEDLSSPYASTLNTTTLSNGNHTLSARARDAAGNTATSSIINITVNNDTEAPSVNISAPSNGTTVAGTINVTADATDNTAVAGVQFLLDGVNLGVEDLIAPYTISWNTTLATDGNHILTARARDAAGNLSTSSPINVSILNTLPDTESPAVSIDAPSTGTTSGTITIDATATDNIGIMGVQFLVDGADFGAEDMAAPYSISLNTLTLSNGDHTISARARDAAGNNTTASTVVITVDNDTEAPSISITTPTAGETLAGIVNIGANASDNKSVLGVQFLIDGVNVGAEITSAPYTFSWNTASVPDGNHQITARARDAAGNSTVSSIVSITVLNTIPDTEAPSVSITAPAAGTISGSINIAADASDNTGVVGVQFQLNGANLLAEDLSAPYTISWNTSSVANGTYTLTAIARDAAGNATSSSTVVVTVNNLGDVEAPTVSISSPATGTVTGTINVTANASDNVGVAGVQFLLDGVALGAEDLTAPYSIAWNSVGTANGVHILTARARDAAGNNSVSTDVSVTVNNDTQAPAVAITAPTAGTVSATINITATASDNVGVVGVQFLLDGVNLGTEDLSSPYSFSWNTAGVTNGAHTISARARDAAGNTTTSTAISVNVSNITTLLTAMHFNESSGTAVADISGNAHNGTLTNGPTRIAGKYGQAANFDGTDDYLNIPDHADYTLDPTQSYTWSAWVKNNNFNAWGTVWSQTIDLNNFFYFYAHSTTDAEAGPVTNGITIYWWTNGGSNKVVIHSNNNVLTASQWNFITVTYNASLAQASRFTIYVNGSDVTNRSDVLSSGTLASINPTNIRLGANQPWGDFLNGGIDEVRYYKKLLTPAEITADMNTPIGVDNIAPTVTISSPATGTTVAGTVNLTADASDNFGVTGVQFLVDGVVQGAEDLTAPYSATWNTVGASNGTHIITAIARDAAGNSTTSAPISVTIMPDFSFIPQSFTQSLGTTSSASFPIDIAFLNGFSSSNIALSVSGAPANVTATYATNPMTGPGQAQLVITSTNATPGTYTLTLGATANSITHTQQVTLVINGVADFNITPTPLSQNVVAGSPVSFTVSLGETGDFVNPVTLSVQGLPSGVTASFSPAAPIPIATSTLTLTTTTAVVNGTYTLTIRGVSGALTRTADITLTVSSIPPSSLSLPPGFSVINVGGASWDQPMGTVFTTDGQKMFVWEKKGTVYVCTRNAQQLYDRQSTQVLNIEPEVGNWGDHGLMSIALDPAFSSSTGGYIYLLYVVDRRFLLNDNSIPADQGFDATIGRITRYKVINSGGNLVIDPSPTERKVLLGETKETGIPILHDSHGLGTILFAADGTLIASAGDGGNYLSADVGNDPASYYVKALNNGIIRPAENVGAFRAQLLNSHNGKILRMDPATGDGLSSNPYYNASAPRSPRSRVWALGLRNPFRITIRPGSGSTNPAAGDVGDIYIGDVGWNTWEELNIVDEPGMNCGWPLFEGLNAEPTYSASTALNQDEPNPLGCSAFFQFRQLLKQATADGITTVFNPCNTSIAIPGSTSNNRFYHRRPSMEWKHGADIARVGIFTGNTADVATIGTPGSGVTGTPFRGNSSTGGCWYTGTLFPAQYRNTYFQGDYGAQWMKDFRVDFTDVVQEVQNFASGFGAIISMTENPADGTIYCVDLGDNTVKRISYGGNQFPVVKMSSDKTYGPSALNVSFTGSNSFDPEGSALTYNWNFGDNTTSTLANPVHSFASAPNTVSKFVVKLTVRDNQNASATDSIIISVNNTPPVVTITSPVNNSLYRIGPDTSYTCTAIVTDAEHVPGQLKYQWQTFLRHNNHEHPAPIDTTRNTTTFLARVGCNGDEYSYFIKLTVTDAGGLSTVDSVKIFPDCSVGRGVDQGELVGVEKKIQNITPINMADVADGLLISPNPVTGPFHLTYIAPSAGDVLVRITDMNGKLVSVIRRFVSRGSNTLSIQARTEWSNGTYLVAIVQGKRVRKGKFLFQGASKE